MVFYKNTKTKVLFADRDTDFFDIVVRVLPGDTFAQYLFIICLEYALQDLIINGFIDLLDLIINGYILKEPEADDILQKLCKTQTTQIMVLFWQIYQPKKNPYCTA